MFMFDLFEMKFSITKIKVGEQIYCGIKFYGHKDFYPALTLTMFNVYLMLIMYLYNLKPGLL